MINKLFNITAYILSFLFYDKACQIFDALACRTKLASLRRKGIHLNFVPQGGYRFFIAGPLDRFFIDETSHIKSDTFIECSGGVSIGKYFHSGRCLTIFSSAHDYKNATCLPYDEKIIPKPVNISNYVWCGANVTILPGVSIGEGAIIGAASVVTKNVPPLAIVVGNPHRIIGYRDINHFTHLKSSGRFY